MKYSSTVTSKGTITLAAPLRRAVGIKPGHKVSLILNDDRQIVVSSGTSIAEFEKIRDQITSRIPSHKKGLTGQALKDAASKAWIADHE